MIFITGPSIDENGISLGETDSAVLSFALKDKNETGMLKVDILSLDGALSVDWSGQFDVDVGLRASVLSIKVEQDIDYGLTTLTPSVSGDVLTLGGAIGWDADKGELEFSAPSAGWVTDRRQGTVSVKTSTEER